MVVVAVVEELAVVGLAVEHEGTVMTLSSSVTAPVPASSRPITVAPVCAVIEAPARMLPANALLVASVADVGTTQKTLQSACALSVKATALPEPVINVLVDWNTNSASGSVELSRVTVPLRANTSPGE